MEDRHLGRNSPTFTLEGHPEKFNNLIAFHGMLARIMRARKCPCKGSTGSPEIFCKLCKGDGLIYDFQRKFLQADEDSDVRGQANIVYPFRVPIIDVVKVERLLPEEQGGIVKYNISSFDTESIIISAPTGKPLPKHYEKMRVSYYFDRLTRITGEQVNVNAATRTLTTNETLYDGEHRFGNAGAIHGDIIIVDRVYHSETGFDFTDYTFNKRSIYLSQTDPEPEAGKILVDYFYAPPARVLPADLDLRQDQENFSTNLTSGTTRIGVDSWWDLSPGDLITLLPIELYKDEVLAHSNHGLDKLTEFDVCDIDDIIFDEDGLEYRKNTDFILRDYHNIDWIGNQPNYGKNISVRYAYRPTYSIFQEVPIPNAMENKKFPKTFYAHYYNKTLQKEPEKKSTVGFPGLQL